MYTLYRVRNHAHTRRTDHMLVRVTRACVYLRDASEFRVGGATRHTPSLSNFAFSEFRQLLSGKLAENDDQPPRTALEWDARSARVKTIRRRWSEVNRGARATRGSTLRKRGFVEDRSHVLVIFLPPHADESPEHQSFHCTVQLMDTTRTMVPVRRSSSRVFRTSYPYVVRLLVLYCVPLYRGVRASVVGVHASALYTLRVYRSIYEYIHIVHRYIYHTV